MIISSNSSETEYFFTLSRKIALEMMKWHLFFFSLVFLFFQVKGNGGCRDLTYLDCQKNKAFIGHVIKTMRVLAPGLEECQHQCFMERKCVSYNLGPDGGLSRICNLSDTDHVFKPDDVKSVPGAEYCPIKNPCSNHPCVSNLACEPDFSTFKCLDKTSCAGLKSSGMNNNGAYNITPVPGYTIEVYCDQETDGGGWTVIQKRFDGSVDFYRGWNDYKNGFGNKNGEYWLGLDAIHILTNSKQYEIRIDLGNFSGNAFHAFYDMFKVGPESQKYKLFLGSFKAGNAGDSLGYHRFFYFTTFDQDNDEYAASNCAEDYRGAWWFGACFFSHLNGQYLGAVVSGAQGISWDHITGDLKSLKKSEMKVRPVGFKG